MPKSNRGITLTSLVIYVIELIIITGIMSTWLGYFNKNLDEVIVQNDSKEEYARFLAFITKDTNSKESELIKLGKDNIVFQKGNEEHQYILQENASNNALYYVVSVNESGSTTINKKIILCTNVSKSGADDVFKYSEGKITYVFNIDDDKIQGNLSV